MAAKLIYVTDDEFAILSKYLNMGGDGFGSIFKEHMPDVNKADKTVDFYVAAGMLKIKEEEVLPGLPIGFEFPFSKRDEWTNCCNEMFKQGYKISK